MHYRFRYIRSIIGQFYHKSLKKKQYIRNMQILILICASFGNRFRLKHSQLGYIFTSYTTINIKIHTIKCYKFKEIKIFNKINSTTTNISYFSITKVKYIIVAKFETLLYYFSSLPCYHSVIPKM